MKARLIVVVLDISRTGIWPRSGPLKTPTYVDMLRELYGKYRTQMDFKTADLRAQEETIQAILDDPEVAA